jgi:hypothetical protein
MTDMKSDALPESPELTFLAGVICNHCGDPLCGNCGFCAIVHNKKGIGFSEATGTIFCEGYKAASEPASPFPLPVATREPNGWIDVKQELPPKNVNHCWLAWITSQNKAGGYIDLVSYGDYVCYDPDVKEGDEGYCEDTDDGNVRKFGWYCEEETHGGEYDYIFVNLNSKVAHWMPPPAPPAAVSVANPEMTDEQAVKEGN